MNRPTRLLAVVGALALLLTGACGDDSNDSTGSSDDRGSALPLVDAGTLTVCSDIPYAPFEFEDAGEVTGIDIDLMRAIAKKLDLDVEVVDTDFDGIFAALSAGKCDVIASSVSITDERKKNNDFTSGYFEINQSLLVAADEADVIDSLDDMAGKVVGVQSETTGATYASERAGDVGYTIKEFTGADELFTALKAGQVAGVLQDFPINSYHAETTGDSAVAVVFDSDEVEEYGFVVKKGNDELLTAIDDALADLRSDGTYDDILAEYLGDR